MSFPFKPNYAVPPGETLLETIEGLGMSQADLARRMGRPLKTVNEIIKGKAAITADTALQLEKVVRVAASFWNNAERNYREALARLDEQRRLEDQAAWLKQLPMKKLIDFAWVKHCEESSKQVEEVLQFFGVASAEAWRTVWVESLREGLAVEFRRSKSFESSWPALAAWLRKGELEAQGIHCANYQPRVFTSALDQIRGLTTEPPEVFEPRMVELCAQAGVAVTFVPPLPKTHVSGATRWLGPSKALVQLSLRGKSDDLLWFTFFHEAGHILLHGKRDVFIEDGQQKSSKEAEADRFAADFLIPPTQWGQFIDQGRVPGRKDVIGFATELGIAPGIVVGRLQHEGILPRNFLNGLKVRFDFVEPTSNN